MVTLTDLLDDSLKKYGDRIGIKSIIDGTEHTYKQIGDISQSVAAILKKKGLEKGDRAVIITENNPWFVFADYGVLYSGATSVPIDETLSDKVLKSYLTDAEPKVIIVQEKFYERIKNLISEKIKLVNIGELKNQLYYHSFHNRTSFKFGDYVKPLISDGDLSTIIYSSGTSSDSENAFKGIMLSHNNIASNILASKKMMDAEPSDVYLTGVAQASHSFEYMLQKTMLSSGSLLYFTDIAGLQKHKHGVKINPTHMIMIPRMANLVIGGIKNKFNDKCVVINNLFNLAINNSNAYHAGADNGNYNMLRLGLHMFADNLFYSKIRKGMKEKLGSNIQFLIGGSAPLDIETQNFFRSIGHPIYQGYGLTETSPVISVNTPNNYKVGSSGKLIDGIEVKIVNLENGTDITSTEKEGLIYVRGPNVFKGYWKRPQKTSEVLFSDGFFNTEDIGRIDKENFLYITGREKDLIVLSTGKKIVPTPLEAHYENNGSISRLICVGDKKGYLSALVIPKPEIINQLKQGAIYEAELRIQILEELKGSDEIIKKIALVHDFDEARYITRKQSLKRGIFLSDNKHLIDRLYSSK